MSKDQEKNYKLIVDNVDKIIDYCISTLYFWKCNETWPTNLVTESLEQAHNFIKTIKLNVSVSHIIDK